MNFKRFSCPIFLLGLALITLATFPNPSHAGQLDNFEYQATKSSPEKERHKQDVEIDDDDPFSDCLGSVFKGLAEALVYGMREGVHAVGGRPSPNAPPGLRHLRVIRFDYSYQNVKSDVRGDDFRFELGLDQLAVQVRTTHYRESSPKEDLDVTQGHVLYRIASRHLDLDLGVGALNIQGKDSNTGASFTVPLAVHANDYLSLEFRPSWSFIANNTINDYDLALSCGWKYVALRGGYRWLRAHSASLDGPYLGISLRY